MGWFFEAQFNAADAEKVGRDRLDVFRPTHQPRPFTFEYDPDAGEHGRITYSLDGKSATMDLTTEQRQVGASFDRFGLANVRRGGNSVTAHFDDLSYTTKSDIRPQRHKQQITEVKRPSSGRMY